MLDTFRFLSGVTWCTLCLFLTGSIWRVFRHRANYKDRQWVMCWFFAILMTGYFVRLISGLAPSLEPGPQYSLTLGLQVLSFLIGARIWHVRIDTQGWRW